ncbi:Ni/Fe hydrogenase subunit alpha [Pelagibaculum spongiae]|uniref:Ni/Fe hydrogenase subunit alpha n=1 Tax=Pelagibaculum spongiae TaxID=2080658 RepID=A0A2V1GXY9_9GAMM|nr:Ni/Fe hydrogenase subunit alpha [Pelagibaculum spongiae]PVZ65424.1 Ni/Fe hydrogenase subunit alpha [Pelagibaculum spongiae]
MENQTQAGLRRIAIEPISRVEGHGKITLLLDDEGHVKQARLHIVEFRGFEKFIEGRPYYELPLLVQRLCGICPVSHHLAAAKAIDQINGVKQLTPAALKLRQLLHWGQLLQSHALHFFHLASPDLLFGYDSDVSKRNIIGVLKEYPEIAVQGVKIRKFGQEVIRAVSGKRIHGIAALPGGMNQPLDREVYQYLTAEIDQIVEWSKDAVELARRLCLEDTELFNSFASTESPYMSLTDEKGGLEFYDGNLRVKNADGSILNDQFPNERYTDLIQEEAKSWSYMKFPFLRSIREAQGGDSGWYRVGPLARINNCDSISTPLAEHYRQDFMKIAGNPLAHQNLAFHWARMIEALHCAESIQKVLADPDLFSLDLVAKGNRQSSGIGIIEAPRGTLFHHYEVNDDDQVTMANLIVSTTSNNFAMNEAVCSAANQHIDGNEVTPGLLNLLEVAVRSYDPCLSCATHAIGKMPLHVEMLDSKGQLIHQLSKNSNGEFS